MPVEIPGTLLLIQLLANVPKKIMMVFWVPATQMGDPDGVIDTWFCPACAPATGVTWEANQQIEISLSLPHPLSFTLPFKQRKLSLALKIKQSSQQNFLFLWCWISEDSSCGMESIFRGCFVNSF